MSDLVLKIHAKAFLTDLNLVRGSVGRSDLVTIGEGELRGSDGVWGAAIERPEYQSEQSISLSYMKLLEVVRACDMEAFVVLVRKKSKCVVKSKGAGWVLNIRSDKVPELPDVEGEEKKASIPSLLDSYLSLKHLIKLDLSRPGLMFGGISDQFLAIGDGARLGVVECYCSPVDFPLVVFQELTRILREGEEQELIWVENSEFFDFSTNLIRFTARKLEGGFEREWKEEIERQIKQSIAEFVAPKSAILSAVNQTLVVSEDLIKMSQRDGQFVVVEAVGEGGEKAVSKVELVDSKETFESVIISGLDFREALQARRDPSIYIFVCEKFLTIRDSQGFEVLCRRVL